MSERSERREFLGWCLLAAAALSGCGARRRVRRRTRRRVLWRTVQGRRVLVVPVDVEPEDELEFDDGRVGTVVEVRADTIVVNVAGRRETHAAVFE